MDVGTRGNAALAWVSAWSECVARLRISGVVLVGGGDADLRFPNQARFTCSDGEVPVTRMIRMVIRVVALVAVVLLGSVAGASAGGGDIVGGPVQDVYDGYAIGTMSARAASTDPASAYTELSGSEGVLVGLDQADLRIDPLGEDDPIIAEPQAGG
jgi:hypothetical protein